MFSSHKTRRLQFVVLAFIFLPCSSIYAQVTVDPDEGVSFYQVDFKWFGLSILNSNTGEMQVGIADLQAATGMNSGFLNVRTDQGWVVQNVPVLPDFLPDYPSIATSFQLSANLNPNNIPNVDAHVAFSSSPVTAFPPGPLLQSHSCGDIAKNAQGTKDKVGQALAPPQPGVIAFLAGLFAFASQPGHSNAHAAENQCGPMAAANSLDWLRAFHGIAIPAAHAHVPGDGCAGADGSLVSELDLDMARVCASKCVGGGVDEDEFLEGKLEYLSTNGLGGAVLVKHQDNGRAATGLPGGVNFKRHGLTSLGKGAIPTADFIFAEISHDEDVELLYRWVASGHYVVVVAAGKILGIPWVRYISDTVQASTDDPPPPAGCTAADAPANEGVGPATFSFLWDTNGDGVLNLVNEIGMPEVVMVVSESPMPDPHKSVPGDELDGSQMEFGVGNLPAIPADFFEPGSDPFLGVVLLEGEPIDSEILGETSTLIRRSGPPVLPEQSAGAEGTVEVEIVDLNLVSLEPITVTSSGGQNPELWDVRVTLSAPPVAHGLLTATKTHDNGGTFDVTFNVQPLFTFTRVSDGAQLSLDAGDEGSPPLQFSAFDVPFVHSLDPSLGVFAPYDGLFVPGVEETVPDDPTSQETRKMIADDQSGAARHTVVPQTLCPLPFETPLDPCFALRQRDCAGPEHLTCLPSKWTAENLVTECDCLVDIPLSGCGALDVSGAPILQCGASCEFTGEECEIEVNGVRTGQSWIDEADVPPGAEVTCGCPSTIPAVSEWGIVALTLLILVGGTLVLIRGRLARQ